MFRFLCLKLFEIAFVCKVKLLNIKQKLDTIKNNLDLNFKLEICLAKALEKSLEHFW